MAATAEQSLRRSAREIFEHVENNAHEELRRSTQALAFSGFAGGLSMGLTGLAEPPRIDHTLGREHGSNL